MTIKKIHFLSGIIALLLAIPGAYAADTAQIITPPSSVDKPEDAGLKARTHFKFLVPPGGYAKFHAAIAANTAPLGGPPYLGYGYETPASLACVYNRVPRLYACNPNKVTTVVTGGSKAIALVDAYHYPNALSDLQMFSTQFGLPAPDLEVVYASGTQPKTDPNGWEVEEALDLQWAHAMAPNAKLYLVEAASNSNKDLTAAVDVASALVAAAGGGQVSMSYGGAEFTKEVNFESHYTTPNVVYFASSGDAAGTSYPCMSANVVCVGGTTLRREPATQKLTGEVAWIDSGGGISPYIKRPGYQDALAPLIGSTRAAPDVSLAADPITGGWLYYTASNNSKAGWFIVGGTSWSSPTLAGIVNAAGSFEASSQALLAKIYGGTSPVSFTDISKGWCGPYAGWNAVAGWDPCTGLGKVGQ